MHPKARTCVRTYSHSYYYSYLHSYPNSYPSFYSFSYSYSYSYSCSSYSTGQSNSEHSRHWFFGGKMVIDGEEKTETLFSMVKSTLPAVSNSVIAFHDNSSVRVRALIYLSIYYSLFIGFLFVCTYFHRSANLFSRLRIFTFIYLLIYFFMYLFHHIFYHLFTHSIIHSFFRLQVHGNCSLKLSFIPVYPNFNSCHFNFQSKVVILILLIDKSNSSYTQFYLENTVIRRI